MKTLLIWLLPAALLGLTGILFGYYYESNDDVAITQVLRGQAAVAPVANLHLYFHGLSFVLAALYRMAPLVPWFGITLYLLLYASLVLLYHVLFDVLRPKGSTLSIAVVFSLLYWFAWQETALLMNFTRLPVLLVGSGVLFAAHRGGKWLALGIGMAAVALGWCIRPSAGVLGLVAAIPAAWWLGRQRALVPVLCAGMLMVLGSVAISSSYTPVERAYRRLDVWKSSYSDFLLYQTKPVTTADSLGVLSVQTWSLGDSTVVNEALFNRVFYFDRDVFVRQKILQKSFASFYALRDYYALLVLFPMAVGLWLSWRRKWLHHWEFWLAQVAFTALLLALTIAMKLPLRVASPLLSVWTAGIIIYVAQSSPGPLRLPAGWRWALYALVPLFSYKLWHDSRAYKFSQERNEAYLKQIYALAQHKTLMSAGVEWAYEMLSPFTTYQLSDKPVVTMMGWLTLEPSLVELREQLTGTRDFEESLHLLSTRPDAIWIMRDDYAAYLRKYTRAHRSQSAVVLEPTLQKIIATNPEFARLYTVRLRPRPALGKAAEVKSAAGVPTVGKPNAQ